MTVSPGARGAVPEDVQPERTALRLLAGEAAAQTQRAGLLAIRVRGHARSSLFRSLLLLRWMLSRRRALPASARWPHGGAATGVPTVSCGMGHARAQLGVRAPRCRYRPAWVDNWTSSRHWSINRSICIVGFEEIHPQYFNRI